MTPENTNNKDETLSTGDLIMGVVAFFSNPDSLNNFSNLQFFKIAKKTGQTVPQCSWNTVAYRCITFH